MVHAIINFLCGLVFWQCWRCLLATLLDSSPYSIFFNFSADLILMDDHDVRPVPSRGPSPWFVQSNVRMAGGTGLGGRVPCGIVVIYTVLAGAVYSTFAMVVMISLYTPPSMLTKLNTSFILFLIPSEKSDGWLLMYSLKVLFFHLPIF